MKKMRLLLIALSLLAGSAYMKADIVEFGSESLTEWNATADDGCDMGSTVSLDGVKVTLGSPDDAGVTWTWHAGNAGLLPSQMPSTDGTAETLITEFSEEAPFGNLPSHGAFLKIEPTKAGTITISGKASANAAQPLVFVTLSKEDPTVILSAQITPWDNSVTQWSYDVDADHVYCFFQLSYPGKLTAYRITLRGISFADSDVSTGLNKLHAAPAADDASFFDLSGRRANDKSGIRIVNGRKFYFKK